MMHFCGTRSRFHQVLLVDAGLWILGREDLVGSMAVSAPCNLFRKAETVVFAVIALHVGFHRYVEDAVTLHHLLVAVALHANFRVEFAVGMGFRITQRLNVMQIMAVVTGG